MKYKISDKTRKIANEASDVVKTRLLRLKSDCMFGWERYELDHVEVNKLIFASLLRAYAYGYKRGKRSA